MRQHRQEFNNNEQTKKRGIKENVITKLKVLTRTKTREGGGCRAVVYFIFNRWRYLPNLRSLIRL